MTKIITRPHHLIVAITAAAILAVPLVFAAGEDDLTDPTVVVVDDTAHHGGHVVTKLSQEFAEFLGGEDNARIVIEELRDGSYGTTPPPDDADPAVTEGSVTPTRTDTTTANTIGDTTPEVTDSPESGQTMGYGNIRITLKMAQAELDKLGIIESTDEQLQAVLNGGSIDGTDFEGILTMRADGMGWGNIAKSQGYSVGQLMGKGHAKPKPAHTSQASSDYIPSSKASSGVYSASGGAVHGNSKAKGQTKVSKAGDYIPSGKAGKAYGQGLVTGMGGSGLAVSSSKGGTHKGSYKSGIIVSAAGDGAATAASLASTVKGGRGLAKGHNK